MRFLFLFQLVVFTTLSLFSQDFNSLRERMVTDQLHGRDIEDQLVLDAFRRVERHQFVPEYLQSRAYDDSPLPIGLGQTISQPYMVALMTQLLDLKPHYKVLEIGTGSGYQAAILGEIVQEVYTIEIVPELAESSKQLLQNLGYDNIHVYHGDGYHGLPDFSPFDAIIVTAAAENIPPALVGQLGDGKKMIIPVGVNPWSQSLMLVEKKNGKILTSSIIPVRFVPFTRSGK